MLQCTSGHFIFDRRFLHKQQLEMGGLLKRLKFGAWSSNSALRPCFNAVLFACSLEGLSRRIAPVPQNGDGTLATTTLEPKKSQENIGDIVKMLSCSQMVWWQLNGPVKCAYG